MSHTSLVQLERTIIETNFEGFSKEDLALMIAIVHTGRSATSKREEENGLAILIRSAADRLLDLLIGELVKKKGAE